MYRPIIILTKPVAGDVVVSYQGEDAAKADAIYNAESQNAKNEFVQLYSFPTPRLTSYPSSTEQLLKSSLCSQESGCRHRKHAEIKAEAKARLTREKIMEIEAAAQAEADAALNAGQTAAAVVNALTDSLSQGADRDEAQKRAEAELAAQIAAVGESTASAVTAITTPPVDTAPVDEKTAAAPKADDTAASDEDPSARFRAPAKNTPKRS